MDHTRPKGGRTAQFGRGPPPPTNCWPQAPLSPLLRPVPSAMNCGPEAPWGPLYLKPPPIFLLLEAPQNTSKRPRSDLEATSKHLKVVRGALRCFEVDLEVGQNQCWWSLSVHRRGGGDDGNTVGRREPTPWTLTCTFRHAYGCKEV